jgi:hypothetical protein
MRLGPEFLVVVFVQIGNLLNSRPAKDSIVTNERSNVSVSDCVANGRVDQVGEEGDPDARVNFSTIPYGIEHLPILKVSVDDLHDTGRELHNAHFGGGLHFGACIEKTVSRNTSIGVD